MTTRTDPTAVVLRGAAWRLPEGASGRIVDMYAAGVPVPEIASRLGVSERTVYRHVSASGVEHVRAPREPRGLTGGSWRYCPRRRVQVWVEETAA